MLFDDYVVFLGPECQDTARNMNILFNDNLNLEYVNQGLL